MRCSPVTNTVYDADGNISGHDRPLGAASRRSDDDGRRASDRRLSGPGHRHERNLGTGYSSHGYSPLEVQQSLAEQRERRQKLVRDLRDSARVTARVGNYGLSGSRYGYGYVDVQRCHRRRRYVPSWADWYVLGTVTVASASATS